MTKEKAMAILYQMLDEFCNEEAWVQEYKEAVDIAVQALSKKETE